MAESKYSPSRLKGIQPPPASEKGGAAGKAITHGAHTFLTSGVIPCNKCLLKDECDQFREDESCWIITAYQVEKVREIMSLPYVEPQDVTLAQMLARELAFQAVVSKYIAKEGLFKPDEDSTLSLQPVLKSYWVSVNAATRMCDALGLSPMARARLGVGEGGGFNFARAIQEVEGE